jgi:hypothetical protein
MINRFKIKTDTQANFWDVNPILKNGELAYCSDINKLAIGDGVTPFRGLFYTDKTQVMPRPIFPPVVSGGLVLGSETSENSTIKTTRIKNYYVVTFGAYVQNLGDDVKQYYALIYSYLQGEKMLTEKYIYEGVGYMGGETVNGVALLAIPLPIVAGRHYFVVLVKTFNV